VLFRNATYWKSLTDGIGVTVPGVAVASFLYLGFIAAGEEIEQPFGYGRYIHLSAQFLLTVIP
jgi:hypothetical protein